MSTRIQTLRYQDSSQRNVTNLVSRVNGVNLGNAISRLTYLSKLAERGITLESLKLHAGVRVNDSTYDVQLRNLVEQVQAYSDARKKAEKKAEKKGAANSGGPDEAKSTKAPVVKEAGAQPAEKTKKFKKGRRPDLMY